MELEFWQFPHDSPRDSQKNPADRAAHEPPRDRAWGARPPRAQPTTPSSLARTHGNLANFSCRHHARSSARGRVERQPGRLRSPNLALTSAAGCRRISIGVLVRPHLCSLPQERVSSSGTSGWVGGQSGQSRHGYFPRRGGRFPFSFRLRFASPRLHFNRAEAQRRRVGRRPG